ncbi:Hpt domain-containing protein [Methyloversatilis sp.]|uniref:Hpt domain-containing protein n=1 Tax=Methyloversatilis sp. TaxID=2569862 RepID=UPI00273331BE|nr:Hpt domain-containing protein [Methyloversatilis sp.]MDP2870435.1 Hpt domain-containing protein [Methyloversatilis sp.]MDP3288069.1 Hpt domain-containing protein [Methyloversatilis sp.]MDP3457246.1 Hpt domain-containing protein [Methyloversatilis sp.]MDP3576638.1 Hpt domain-containing protein [Methyloversatilis sp.]
MPPDLDTVASRVIDVARLDDLRALLGDALDDILRIWLNDAPAGLAAARSAWQAGEPDALIKVIHGLKGSAGNVGAIELSDTASILEQRLKRSGPALDLDAELAQLDTCYERAACHIRNLIRT